MNNYIVLQNLKGSTLFIKEGWNWPAFFFTWLWAFSKSMFIKGFAIIGIVFFLVFFLVSLPKEYVAIYLFVQILPISINIFMGNKGNNFLITDLEKKGYKPIKEIEAKNKVTAISIFNEISV